MTRLAIKQVDAFTTTPFTGNPAGVVTDAHGLTPDQMQAIAREMNLSETAFVDESAHADFRVRFFTPTAEIPLAGHPTIATMHALAEEGRIPLRAPVTVVTQELNVGVLPVELHVEAQGRVTRVVMTQKRPEFLATYERPPLAEALGIALEELRDDVPIQTVSTGSPQLMVPVRRLQTLEWLKPDFNRLSELTLQSDYLGLHVFAAEGYRPESATHARHFAPALGVAEDPVTGSASGGMGAYCWRYGLVRSPQFQAEQGDIVGRPGLVQVEVVGPPAAIATVKVGGQAVTVLEGTLIF